MLCGQLLLLPGGLQGASLIPSNDFPSLALRSVWPYLFALLATLSHPDLPSCPPALYYSYDCTLSLPKGIAMSTSCSLCIKTKNPTCPPDNQKMVYICLMGHCSCVDNAAQRNGSLWCIWVNKRCLDVMLSSAQCTGQCYRQKGFLQDSQQGHSEHWAAETPWKTIRCKVDY